jgi:hypothetical protein
MADGQGFRMGDEAGVAAHRAFGKDVVEDDGVNAAEEQIRIRMHIIVVGHGGDAGSALGFEQQIVGHRAASVATRRPLRSASDR